MNKSLLNTPGQLIVLDTELKMEVITDQAVNPATIRNHIMLMYLAVRLHANGIY